MKTVITANQYRSKASMKVSYNPVGKCPHCGTSFNGEVAKAVIVPWGLGEHNMLVVIHYCHACNNAFTGVYISPEPIPDIGEFNLLQVWPKARIQTIVDADIRELSPDFAEIYAQAAEAESSGLNRVCGIAYRKALEFLVKDYAIHRDPDNEDEIKAMQLGKVIDKHIDNQRIKELAKKSAWIGNDETHYVRKHEDRSVEDLKKFLHAMLTFISAELAVDDAMTIT